MQHAGADPPLYVSCVLFGASVVPLLQKAVTLCVGHLPELEDRRGQHRALRAMLWKRSWSPAHLSPQTAMVVLPSWQMSSSSIDSQKVFGPCRHARTEEQCCKSSEALVYSAHT